MQHPRHVATYRKFRDATMIPLAQFSDNLSLAQKANVTAGDWFVECGTWKGGMAASLIEGTLGLASYAFLDSFQGLPPAGLFDGDAAHAWQADTASVSYHENCAASRTDFEANLARADCRPTRMEIHEGWFENTIPQFEHDGIAFLRLDGDWYDSTMTCLEWLFPRLRVGGIAVFDDYGTWAGCTRAVHDYLSANRRPEAVERTRLGGVPFLIKQPDQSVIP